MTARNNEKPGTAPGQGPDVMRAWRQAMRLPMDLGIEWIRFVGRRLQADADYLAEMVHVHSAFGAARTTRNFAEAARADYQDEAEAISRMALQTNAETR